MVQHEEEEERGDRCEEREAVTADVSAEGRHEAVQLQNQRRCCATAIRLGDVRLVCGERAEKCIAATEGCIASLLSVHFLALLVEFDARLPPLRGFQYSLLLRPTGMYSLLDYGPALSLGSALKMDQRDST